MIITSGKFITDQALFRYMYNNIPAPRHMSQCEDHETVTTNAGGG